MSAKVTSAAVRAILKEWRPVLGLDSRWSIDVRLYQNHWPKSAKGATAFIKVNSGYFQARIHLNVPSIEKDGNTLEYIVLHELNHIVVEPLAVAVLETIGKVSETTAVNMMEATVEQYTRALLKVKHG